MTDKELKEIRQKISCPQLGDNHYGEWGILTKNQRFTIKRMLDYIESQEIHIKQIRAENKKLKMVIENFKMTKESHRKLLYMQEAVINELANKLEELVGDTE